jgi:hypothetical protein
MAVSTIQKQTGIQRVVLDIPKNTYAIYAQALAAMYTAWSGLSMAQKANSYIIYGSNYIKYSSDILQSNYATYNRITLDVSNNSITLEGFSLKANELKKYTYKSNTITQEDKSSNTQAGRITLYTTC